MRDYEYRGLNTKGEWVYGSLVVTTTGLNMPKEKRGQHTKTWIVQSAFGNGGWFNIMQRQYVRPKTVGEYIGRKDRVGKKIYEGDILVLDKNKPQYYVVQYEDNKFVLRSGSIALDSIAYFEGREVVGSIHKNPELLTSEEAA